MRSAAALLALASLAGAGPAAAQSGYWENYAGSMRERARSDGWVREDLADGSRIDEMWCPPPGGCVNTTGDVLRFVTWGALSRSLEHRRTSADGWTATASLGFWESNPPTFTLRFERGTDVLEIGWELHTPELSDGTYLSRTGIEEGVPDFHAWLAAELPAYLASADALRDRVVLRSEAMRAHVRTHAAALSVCDDPHDPRRLVCVPGPDGSHGMMDTCVRRILTDAERTAFVTATEAMLDERNRIVRAHAPALHAAVEVLFRGPP